mmetsp:Transcript_36738/g.105607  ORF Transcript_36738/g.105607 Transcript_36738/m.105607 type:complete len:241 (+) Transcript_36738:479-1201(+)
MQRPISWIIQQMTRPRTCTITLFPKRNHKNQSSPVQTSRRNSRPKKRLGQRRPKTRKGGRRKRRRRESEKRSAKSRKTLTERENVSTMKRKKRKSERGNNETRRSASVKSGIRRRQGEIAERKRRRKKTADAVTRKGTKSEIVRRKRSENGNENSCAREKKKRTKNASGRRIRIEIGIVSWSRGNEEKMRTGTATCRGREKEAGGRRTASDCVRMQKESASGNWQKESAVPTNDASKWNL